MEASGCEQLGPTRLRAMLPEDGNRVRFPNVVFFKEVLDDGQNLKKKVRVSE